MQRRDLLSHVSLGCLSCFAAAPTPAAQPPALWLANPYQGHEKLTDYWVSEKYDGIRGYWDGHKLLSRSGKALNPPAWFVQAWPAQPFEGELWAGLGQFEQAASVVQQKQASDSAWRDMRFMVFDASTPAKTFTERIQLYQGLGGLLRGGLQGAHRHACLIEHCGQAFFGVAHQAHGGGGLVQSFVAV